jgi:N-acyl-D-aspartate/D-glutamate deacylase
LISVQPTVVSEEEKAAKQEEEQELELDLDIARAYCELTEETVRIFPDVKLHAMVTDLTRLQRQTGEYLESLLDQREQLLMDADTYNDLISCIVGHAQRLRDQNKDASPAMVTKTKKKNGFSNMMKRRTAAPSIQSASMGGGVVGVKQGPMPKKTMSSASILTTTESRRSL